MTSPDVSARPSQVTVAGWAVAISSVFLLLGAFETLGGLHSIEAREQMADRIGSGNLQGLGLSVADALEIKRWALYVSAVAAVATGVLGIYVLRRDKAARIGLTVAAVPIALATTFTQSFLGMMIAAGAAVLWTRTARDWFAGRPITPREPRPVRRPEPGREERAGLAPPGTGGAEPWVPPANSNQPPPTLGWGSAPGSSVSLKDLPPPGSPLTTYRPPPAPDPLTDQPRQVRVACIITWVATAVTAGIALLLLVMLGVDQSLVLEAIRDSQVDDSTLSDDTIVQGLMVGSVVVLLWCTGAALVAVFTWRGLHWAWILHVVSAVLASVLAVWGFPNTLLHLAALGVALGMLTSKPSREWFIRRR